MRTKEVRPSILDRLLDSSSSKNHDSFYSMHELRDSVQRDLRNLLNSRARFVSPDPALRAVRDSIVNYGLPDLTSQPLNSAEGKMEFALWIERAIKNYEPRFKNVSVSPVEGEPGSEGITFRIDAILYADPAPENVCFDSRIDPLTQTFSLSEARP